MTSRDAHDADLRAEIQRTDTNTLRWAITVVRAVRDPSTPGLLVLCMLVATGAVLAAVLGERRDGARATAEMDAVVTELTALALSATRNRPGREG